MNKIKTISLYKFDYVLKDMNSEEFELKGGIYNKSTYDLEGRTLSEIKYDVSGGVEQHYGYAYNEQGVKIADRSWDENGDLIDDMEYDIDAEGKTLFAYKNYLDGSKDTISYRYNEAGKLIEKELRSDEDEVEMMETFAYDGDLQVLHETRGEDGELVFRQETTYNNDGEVLESTTWNAEANASSKVINEYNAEGQLTSVSSYTDAGELIFRASYERSGEQIVRVKEESPEKTVLTMIEYDEKGNAIAQEDRLEDGKLSSRIERNFDDHGNITESEALIDAHGAGRNQHYVLKYEYEFHEE